MKKELDQIIFEITYKCNLNCTFCYNVWKGNGYKKRREMTINQYQQIIKRLPNAKIYGLSGGEPLLRKDIFEIIEVFQPKSNIISLMTSGININDKIILINENNTLPFLKDLYVIDVSGLSDIQSQIELMMDYIKRNVFSDYRTSEPFYMKDFIPLIKM